MPSRTAQKPRRRELLAKLWDLGRKMSTQTVFLHQAIAQGFGLNATDTKCIDLILSNPHGGVTAGWLADESGLTTGAITHILDRLEKREFVERVRDTADRRKIFVRLRPENLKPLIPKYEAVGQAYLELAKQYGDRELELICAYLEKTCEISRRELAKIRLSNKLSPMPREKRTASLAGRRRV
jgi:DNA-binding MarR family transcriptional regulator